MNRAPSVFRPGEPRPESISAGCKHGRRQRLGACSALFVAGVGFALAQLTQASRAAGVEDFYKGRSLSIIIGYSVGGGYDTYGRLLSRYIGEHIPGRPSVVPQNMPGAGSLKAANYIYGVAPKDGTAIATFGRTIPVAPLLAAAGVAFEATKLTWLGSISKDTSLCVTSAKSEVKTWSDFLTKPSTLGGEGAGADPDVFAHLYKNVFGAKGKLVAGYPGTNDVSLAMERGEIDGFCGLSWGTLKSRHPEWLNNNRSISSCRPACARSRSCPTCRLRPTLPRRRSNCRSSSSSWSARKWPARLRRRLACRPTVRRR